MKRYIQQDYNRDANVTTFELNSECTIQASHLFVGFKSEREVIADDVFQFLQTAYDELGGFKSFKDVQRFIDNSYLWYITYDGPQPESLADFDISKVYIVSIFRKKNGLKMVGMARRLPTHDLGEYPGGADQFRRNVSAAVLDHIKFVCKRGWAEVSGRLEKEFKASVGYEMIIDPEEIKNHKIFKDVEVAFDAIHYYRPLYPGEEPSRKIAYGTIKF